MSSLEFRLEKNKWNSDLISKKSTRACMYLNDVELLLILVSTVTGCFSISAFASSVCVPVAIKSCAITAGIKKSQLWRKRKSMIKYC